MFFWCTLFTVVEKSSFNKNFEIEWKQGIEKNNNNTDINTTRNCAFVNFKNYTSLKTSKRIGLVTPTVHPSVLSFKNPKLREQLFSGSLTHESPFNFKNWSGKSDKSEKLVMEKWLIFQKWLNFSPTKIFSDFFFRDKVPALRFKRTLNTTSNEPALIHFVAGKLCSRENLMAVVDLISESSKRTVKWGNCECF